MGLLRILKKSFFLNWLRSKDRAFIEKLRLKKLRDLVKYAMKNSPFYHELYEKAGIKEKDVNTINFKDLPVTNKKLLMDNFDFVVTDSRLKYRDLAHLMSVHEGQNYLYLENQYEIMHTSGSSGYMGIFPISVNDLEMVLAAIHCFIFSPLSFVLRKKRKCRAICYVMVGPRAGTVLSAHGLPRFLGDMFLFSILSPLEETVARLNEIQPDLLSGYASSIKVLALEQLAGRLHISPELIMCSADPLDNRTRKKIKQAFGVEPFDCYASTENLFMGYRHTQEYFSIIDALCYMEGNFTANLYNLAFPLIKYQVDDVYEFIPDFREDPFTKIKLHLARAHEVIQIVNNRGEIQELNSAILGCFYVEGLIAFQFCKKENNTLLLKIVGEQEGLEKRAAEALYSLLKTLNAEQSVRLEVMLIDQIPIDPKTGKYRPICP
jgi:phenylacetate-coenzyme A ligase PaaK-like adenylate-forming protein